MMLVVSKPFLEHWWAVYIAGFIGATLLEYVTGVIMEALFKVRYWDYSEQPFNFQGQICLGSSLAWGGLTLLMNYVIHKPVERVVLAIPTNVLSVVTILLTCYIAGDFVLSFKAALDLRDILVRMEKVREELARVQKRLDVIIAVASDDIETYKQEKTDRVNVLMEEIEERFHLVKEKLRVNPSEKLLAAREEISELKHRYFIEKEHDSQFRKVKDIFQRGLIKGNPTMTSGKYAEALETLKKAINNKKEK